METVYLDDEKDAVVLIDQTLLPNQIKYLHLTTQPEIREAIRALRVRGAPAIGITAIITEFGIVRPPYTESLAHIMELKRKGS